MAAEVCVSKADSASVVSFICLSFTADVQIPSSRDFIPPERRMDRRRLKEESLWPEESSRFICGRMNGETNGFDLK